MSTPRKNLPGFLRRSIRYDDEVDLDQIDKEGDSSSQEDEVDPKKTASNKGASSNGKSLSISETPLPEDLPSTMQAPQPQQMSERSKSFSGSLEQTKDDSTSSRLSNSWQPPPTQDVPPVAVAAPQKSYRETQFDKILGASVVNLTELRRLGWNGIPPVHRATTWKLLLGYLPANAARRQQTLRKRRNEYRDAISQHYDIDDDTRTMQEQETLRQVLVDVPRTAPSVPLFRNDRVKRILNRLLYVWAMRHPASSYVQGINDLTTPLLAVFLADYFEGQPDVLDGEVINDLSDLQLEELEADIYWCLTNLLAGIQDHYTSDQPGVQRMVARLEELVNRIDADLYNHFQDTGIMFLQFAFKWMNCLLLREFPLRCVYRLWDTYLSEKDGFEGFHVYVCAAFLCQFSSQLQQMSFDELFGFMQDIPTTDWTDIEIEVLLSQAFVLTSLFGGSDAHLTSGQTPR